MSESGVSPNASGVEDASPVSNAGDDQAEGSPIASGAEDAAPVGKAGEDQSEPSPNASGPVDGAPGRKAGEDHNIAGQHRLNEPSYADLSYLVVFPGEDRDAFDQLHREVIAEYQPQGRTEESLAFTIAALAWRKDRLQIFQRAEKAKLLFASVSMNRDVKGLTEQHETRWFNLERLRLYESILKFEYASGEDEDAEDYIERMCRAEEDLAELGTDMTFLSTEAKTLFALAKLGDAATPTGFLKHLELQERLDVLLQQAITRLIKLKTAKCAVGLGPQSEASGSPKQLPASANQRSGSTSWGQLRVIESKPRKSA